MDPKLVAVEATEKRYRALRHEPSGMTLDLDTGRGMWPADQFTFRLRDHDRAIRIVEDDAKPAAARATKTQPAPAKAKKAGRAAKPPAAVQPPAPSAPVSAPPPVAANSDLADGVRPSGDTSQEG